jgi:GNAT superfamily N-acetyltransferase
MYQIRAVDGSDDEIADTLVELHQLTFVDAASVPNFDQGHWWLAFHGTEAVAFAGLVPSTHVCNAGYFCRVGVLSEHWGHQLQLRLMRALEARARVNGWCSIVSDTMENLWSAIISSAPATICSNRHIPGLGRELSIGGRSSNSGGALLAVSVKHSPGGRLAAGPFFVLRAQ